MATSVSESGQTIAAPPAAAHAARWAGGMDDLYVGNKKVGETRIEKTVAFAYSFDGALQIGRDPALPVTED